MSLNSLVKVSKDIFPKTLNGLARNKDTLKIAVPCGTCVFLLFRDFRRSMKQKEKDILFQRIVQKRDAEINHYREEALKAKKVEELNQQLQGIIVKLTEGKA